MTASSELALSELAFADVEELMAVIASSPIHVRRVALQALLADWENTRKSADVDDVILAWIASHVSDRSYALS